MVGNEKEPPWSKVKWAAITGVISAVAGAAGVWIGTQLIDVVKQQAVDSAVKTALQDPATLASIVGKAKGPQGDPGLPIGAVIGWPSGQELPSDDWHVCDGAEIPIENTDDPLYIALGRTYGTATSAVVLPDFRGMFLRGSGGVGNHVGAEIGSQQADATRLPENIKITGGQHVHPFSSRKSAGGNSNQPIAGDGAGVWAEGGGHSTGKESVNEHKHQIEGGDPETRPVNYAVHWIIRVQ